MERYLWRRGFLIASILGLVACTAKLAPATPTALVVSTPTLAPSPSPTAVPPTQTPHIIYIVVTTTPIPATDTPLPTSTPVATETPKPTYTDTAGQKVIHATETAQAVLDLNPLALLSLQGYSESDFAIVEGQVRNDGDQPLSDVEAIASWFKADKTTFIKAGHALIDYNPILPGQTSTFKIITSDNPAIKTFRITFQQLGGAEIPHRDLVQ
jgi:hypothetical protein